MSKVHIKSIADIRAGDKFFASGHLVWEAIEDAEISTKPEVTRGPSDTAVRVKVRYEDGGTGYREWTEADHELPIER